MLVKTEKFIYFRSENYNFNFDRKTGFFMRWGKTVDDDPSYSPVGPEIADIEIATSCSGVGKVCDFCYKKNNPNGTYMTLETFKVLFSKLPPTITQIAFGIGNIDSGPDMWKIFDFCREQKVVPNLTINGAGLTDEIAQKLVENCGATAVSYYDKETTFNAVKKLTDLGLKQTNIHFMLCTERYETALSVLNDYKTDDRLKNLNAIVFLSLKKKGRAENRYTQLSQELFNNLVKTALETKTPFGFDSCTYHKFIDSISESENKKQLEMYAEPCESGLFSFYANVNGDFFPCSFAEKVDGWENGISVLKLKNFDKELWNSERLTEWRNHLLECNRRCPLYEI